MRKVIKPKLLNKMLSSDVQYWESKGKVTNARDFLLKAISDKQFCIAERFLARLMQNKIDAVKAGLFVAEMLRDATISHAQLEDSIAIADSYLIRQYNIYKTEEKAYKKGRELDNELSLKMRTLVDAKIFRCYQVSLTLLDAVSNAPRQSKIAAASIVNLDGVWQEEKLRIIGWVRLIHYLYSKN